MKTILTTKTLTEGQKKILNGHSLRLIEHNFISIELLHFKLSLPYNLLIFTSQNGVRSALQHPQVAILKQIPALCVGENTYKLLQNNGFGVLHYTPYATELISFMLKNIGYYQSVPIAFIAGNQRLDTLPAFFKEKHLMVDEIEAYRTCFTPTLIEDKTDAILFFSPSGVQSYCLTNTPKDETIYCIGTTTAEAAARFWQHIFIADTPTVDSVLQKVLTNN